MNTDFKKNFCKSCDLINADYPKCIINNINIKVNLEELLEGNKPSKFEEVFVCPNNAQTYENNKMIINDKCNSCKLCYSLCVHNYPNTFSIPEVSEKTAFSSLKDMNMIFKGFIKGYEFYNEVFAPGNCRSKRIDIVAIKNDRVFLIKVSKDNEKNGFYKRSYIEILNSISLLPEKIKVYIIILLPSNIQKEIKEIDENVYVVPFVELEGFLNSK